MAFLDFTGLSYFYDKLKTVFATKSELSGYQTTLSKMSASELNTGTATTARSITAKVIADYVKGEVSDLVGSAPTTLDTLKELADALGNDANFASTISTQIGNKLDASSANYIKSLSINGTTITYTKGDNTTGTLTTQDSDTTYDAITTANIDTLFV